MKTYIVEDEAHSLKTLLNFIKKYSPEIDVCGTAGLVSKAVDDILRLKPELIFLDIDLPDGNGFEVLSAVESINPKIIFVTAYNQYAIKAFQVSAVDYLLKPLDPELFSKACQKVYSHDVKTNKLANKTLLQNKQKNNIDKLALPTQNGLTFVNSNDIIRLEADGNYTKVFLVSNESLLISKSLKTFEKWLENSSFLRVHHSHIVNLRFLKKYVKGEGGTIVLENNHQVEVSRRRKDLLLQKISNL